MHRQEASPRRCIGLALLAEDHHAFRQPLRGEIAVGETCRMVVEKRHGSLSIAGADGAVSFAQEARFFGQRARIYRRGSHRHCGGCWRGPFRDARGRLGTRRGVRQGLRRRGDPGGWNGLTWFELGLGPGDGHRGRAGSDLRRYALRGAHGEITTGADRSNDGERCGPLDGCAQRRRPEARARGFARRQYDAAARRDSREHPRFELPALGNWHRLAETSTSEHLLGLACEPPPHRILHPSRLRYRSAAFSKSIRAARSREYTVLVLEPIASAISRAVICSSSASTKTSRLSSSSSLSHSCTKCAASALAIDSSGRKPPSSTRGAFGLTNRWPGPRRRTWCKR